MAPEQKLRKEISQSILFFIGLGESGPNLRAHTIELVMYGEMRKPTVRTFSIILSGMLQSPQRSLKLITVHHSHKTSCYPQLSFWLLCGWDQMYTTRSLLPGTKSSNVTCTSITGAVGGCKTNWAFLFSCRIIRVHSNTSLFMGILSYCNAWEDSTSWKPLFSTSSNSTAWVVDPCGLVITSSYVPGKWVTRNTVGSCFV